MRSLTADEMSWVVGGSSNIPAGYTPVGDGSHYMKDAQGRYELTPTYSAHVERSMAENWGIDKTGVVLDLIFVASSGASFAPALLGRIATWAAFASGSLKALIGELDEAISGDKPPVNSSH